MADDSVAQAAMDAVGSIGGVPLFFAPEGRFEKPGLYYWDGETNVHVPIPAPGVPSEHGWLYYGPDGEVHWTDKNVHGEWLAENFRPATALEKTVINAFGNSSEHLRPFTHGLPERPFDPTNPAEHIKAAIRTDIFNALSSMKPPADFSYDALDVKAMELAQTIVNAYQLMQTDYCGANQTGGESGEEAWSDAHQAETNRRMGIDKGDTNSHPRDADEDRS